MYNKERRRYLKALRLFAPGFKIMKIEIVKNIKQIHPNTILCFKVGNFYHCYGKDTYIMSYLFGYNISKSKEENLICGFPVRSISKVLAKLEQNKVDYITIEPRNRYDIEEKQEFNNSNKYEDILKRANKFVRIKKKMQILTEEILKNLDDEQTINKKSESQKNKNTNKNLKR